MTKKLMGSVAYWVVCTTEHIQSGKKSVMRLGPYRTRREAEMKKLEEEEARGRPGYEYIYSIDAAPTALTSK